MSKDAKSERRVVGGGHAGLECQHGDEMGRPNAGTGGDAGEENPAEPFAAVALSSVGINVESGEAGNRTDQNCKQDQSVIMLVPQAREDLEHGSASDNDDLGITRLAMFA